MCCASKRQFVRMRHLLFVIVLDLSFGTNETSGAEAHHNQDASEYLNRFDAVLMRYRNLSATIRIRDQINASVDDNTSGDLPPDKIKRTALVEFHRDHSRLHLFTSQVRRSMLAGKVQEIAKRDEWLITDRGSLLIPLDATGTHLASKNIIALNTSGQVLPLYRGLSEVNLFVLEGLVDLDLLPET